MDRTFPLEERINFVFNRIEDFVNNDNYITDEEFQKIKLIKKELHIQTEEIYYEKHVDIERILYLQFHWLFLEDGSEQSERVEIESYKEVFGCSEDDVIRIEKKVKDDEDAYKAFLHKHYGLSESAKYDRSIPASIKKWVWDRDKGKCVSCGSVEDLEFDHDIPFSKGGSNSMDNIRILCRKCNRKKSANIL